MSVESLVVVVLTMSCTVLAFAQFAELRLKALGLVASLLAGGLVFAGDLASHTSIAELGAYVSDPQRRRDLSAILLLEALLFGSQAIAMAPGSPSQGWRSLGYLPAPSLLMTLFLGQVAVMLAVDGADYRVLAWCGAAVFASLIAAGALSLRWLLPEPAMRSGLRIMLHVVQAGAGLWLARPPHELAQSAGPQMLDRLLIVIGLTLVVVALGWLLQRCSILDR